MKQERKRNYFQDIHIHWLHYWKDGSPPIYSRFYPFQKEGVITIALMDMYGDLDIIWNWYSFGILSPYFSYWQGCVSNRNLSYMYYERQFMRNGKIFPFILKHDTIRKIQFDCIHVYFDIPNSPVDRPQGLYMSIKMDETFFRSTDSAESVSFYLYAILDFLFKTGPIKNVLTITQKQEVKWMDILSSIGFRPLLERDYIRWEIDKNTYTQSL